MNIVLIDDHSILSESLSLSIKKAFAHATVKLFSKPKDFLALDFDDWQPDIVVLDIVMPEIDGIEVFEKVKPLLKTTCKFIFLSALNDVSIVKRSIQGGANGFVSKGAAMEELIEAIKVVQEDRQFVSQSLKEDMLDYLLSGQRPIDASLSPREKEVLQKLCAGKTTKEIAFDMSLSHSTVQSYNTSILKKFKFTRTIDLISFALQQGLYRPLHL